MIGGESLVMLDGRKGVQTRVIPLFAGPLAVTDFAQGAALDAAIKLIGLGGGVGPMRAHESYQLLAWYYLNCVDFPNARPSLIPSLCTRFTRAGIEWRR